MKAVGARLVEHPVLLAGGYLWTVAAAPVVLVVGQGALRGVATLRGVSGALFALVALGCLLGAARSREASPPVSRALGIWGVLGAVALALVLVPEVIDVARLDAVRGALSALGFLLYAMAWGIEERRKAPEDDPRADLDARYPAREPARRAPLVIAGVGIASAGVLLFSAFRVHDVPRAALAHAAAGLASVGVVSAAAVIATEKPRSTSPSPATRLRRAATALVILLALLVAGGAAMLAGRS